MTGSLDAQTVRDALPPRQTGAVPAILPPAQMRAQAAHEALDRLVASVEALTSENAKLERKARYTMKMLHAADRAHHERTQLIDAAEARVVALTVERDEHSAYARDFKEGLRVAEAALQAAEQRQGQELGGDGLGADAVAQVEQLAQDIREDSLEMLALALALYGSAGTEKLGDLIPQRVWDSLHDRELVRTGQDITGDAETYATTEGEELLLRSVEDLAERTSSATSDCPQAVAPTDSAARLLSLEEALRRADIELACAQLPCDCGDGVSTCYCLEYSATEQIAKARAILAASVGDIKQEQQRLGGSGAARSGGDA